MDEPRGGSQVPSKKATTNTTATAGAPSRTAWLADSLSEARDHIRQGRYTAAEALARRCLAGAEAIVNGDPLQVADALDVLVEALYRGGRAQDHMSLEFANRALQIVEKVQGRDHVRAAASLFNLARILYATGDNAGARPLFEQALAIREKALGPDHPDVALSLNGLASLYYVTGDYAAARPRYERALAIREKALGPDHSEVATSLNGLASLYYATGDYGAARPRYERALAIREKALGPGHSEVATSLDNLARLLHATGDYAGARPLYERALAIREKALGPDHRDVASSLNGLASLYYVTGDYVAARPLYERALAIREKALGPDHPDVASSLNGLAGLYYATGDYAAARPRYERALAIREKALGPDHSEVATSLDNLGRLLSATGDYAGARPRYERALAIREKGLGPDHPTVAVSLDELGSLLKSNGDYARARPFYERALAIREKALGPYHGDVAASLDVLGELLRLTGDYAGARPLEERALAIREQTFGPDHREVARSLDNLGYLLYAMGDHSRARPLLERSLAIREKALGPDHREVATSLDDLGMLLRATGDDAGARPLLERSLAIDEKALGLEHPKVAQILGDLASLLYATGDYAGARPLFERSLAIEEIAFGPDHPGVAEALIDLARSRAQAGERSEALEDALRAEEIGREHFRLTVRTLAERQALRYASIRPSGVDVALSLSDSGVAPEATRKIWNAVLRSRALVLDEVASRHRQVSEITQCFSSLTSASERLANLQVRGPGTDAPEVYRRLLDSARQQLEGTERRLAETCTGFRDQQERDARSFTDVASALPPRSALVAFVRFNREFYPKTGPDRTSPALLPAHRTPLRGNFGPVPCYMAFVLSSVHREPIAVALGPAAGVDSLVSRWQEEARRGALAAGSLASVVERGYRTTGEALRKRIWDPIASELGGAERVFVVPDGALNLVSFASLPIGESEYLVEAGSSIHYLSAERDLVHVGADSRSGQGLLALGGPDFEHASRLSGSIASAQPRASAPLRASSAQAFRGERSGCGDLRAVHFEPLPASSQEVDGIYRLWTQADASRARNADALQLAGDAATELAFKEQAPGRRVLHLATHAFFLGAHCPSALETDRGVGGLTASGEREPASVPGENPLLLCGLALAGANQREHAGPDQDDGMLTAQEIAALDLSGVEWAVLSACETGVGEVRAGEGVFGLRRAFQVAGVKTLIMSLWSVEDESAREWMNRLYEARLVKHLSTDEAVRDASLRILRERRAKGESTHPFSWGAFVAAGDWR